MWEGGNADARLLGIFLGSLLEGNSGNYPNVKEHLLDFVVPQLGINSEEIFAHVNKDVRNYEQCSLRGKD